MSGNFFFLAARFDKDFYIVGKGMLFQKIYIEFVVLWLCRQKIHRASQVKTGLWSVKSQGIGFIRIGGNPDK